MVATFHLRCLGHRIKYENPEVGNTTRTMLQFWIYWIFLFWVILVTYDISIYICIYSYNVSYIHPFLVIFNCIVFSALHAKIFWNLKKYFVKLMSRLLYSTIYQVMWYFWVSIVNPFSLLWSIFFSRKLCFLWFSRLLIIATSVSLDTSGKSTAVFFLKITCPSWVILSISLHELNSVDWLLQSWW